MKLTLLKLLLRLLALLPLWLIHGLGWGLGQVVWLWPWRKKAVIATNLELCMSDASTAARSRLARANLVASARLALESGAIWYWPRARLLGCIESARGWHHVERALAAGRGVIFVGAHLGNWELVSLYGSAMMPIVYLYKPPRDPRLNAALTRSRQRFGGELIATGSPSMRRMLRQLRAGGAVGLLCDQQPKQGEGVFAPFFGQPALTMTLVGRLARQTGSPVIFGHCLRLPHARGWRIVVEVAGPEIASPDPVVAATELNRMVERGVRLAPEQYLWLYKRFDLQPAGRESPYRKPR